MKTDQIVMCVVALLLGMLLANMLKNVCGCQVVEGSGDKCVKNLKWPDNTDIQAGNRELAGGLQCAAQLDTASCRNFINPMTSGWEPLKGLDPDKYKGSPGEKISIVDPENKYPWPDKDGNCPSDATACRERGGCRWTGTIQGAERIAATHLGVDTLADRSVYDAVHGAVRHGQGEERSPEQIRLRNKLQKESDNAIDYTVGDVIAGREDEALGKTGADMGHTLQEAAIQTQKNRDQRIIDHAAGGVSGCFPKDGLSKFLTGRAPEMCSKCRKKKTCLDNTCQLVCE